MKIGNKYIYVKENGIEKVDGRYAHSDDIGILRMRASDTAIG